MSDTVKTLPQFSSFGTKSSATVTVTNRRGEKSTFTLTKAQEDAAQAMARGEFVAMARRSGKNLVRQRVLDLLAQGGAKPAKAAKSPTVFTLVKEYEPLSEIGTVLMGTFASKSGAKAAAQADFVALNKAAGYDVDDEDNFAGLDAKSWTNDKNDAETDFLTVGTDDFRYVITGKTLRK